MSKSFWLSILLLIIGTKLCIASIGDEQPEFNHCVDNCVQVNCPAKLEYFLELTKWTCPDNCKYNCMQSITDRAEVEKTPVFQYFGKWPFYRFYGIQEPASVIFSIGNGLIHLYFFSQIYHQCTGWGAAIVGLGLLVY